MHQFAVQATTNAFCSSFKVSFLFSPTPLQNTLAALRSSPLLTTWKSLTTASYCCWSTPLHLHPFQSLHCFAQHFSHAAMACASRTAACPLTQQLLFHHTLALLTPHPLLRATAFTLASELHMAEPILACVSEGVLTVLQRHCNTNLHGNFDLCKVRYASHPLEKTWKK